MPINTTSAEPKPTDRRFRGVALVFMVALIIRTAVGWSHVAPKGDASSLELPDEQQYWLMAESVAAGNGLVDELSFRATRMPLYPLLLAPWTWLDDGVRWARVVNWLMGAAAAALTCVVGRRLFSPRVGLLAGLLVALDPFLAYTSSLLLTETLFSGLLLCLYAVLWTATSRKGEPAAWRVWVGVGLLGAACVYARESSLGLVVGLLALGAWLQRRARRGVFGVVIATVILLAALQPWAFRNWLITGDWCMLTHRTGISLYDGVGPQATGASDLGDVKQMAAVAGLSEVEWNRYFLDESLRMMRSDPWRVVRLAGVKMARMWSPMPNAAQYQSAAQRGVAIVWTIPLFALAAAGFVRCVSEGRANRAMAVALLWPAVYLTVIHAVFVGSIRYRLGAMPFLHILAAAAVFAGIDWIQSSRAQKAVARGH